ncbi:unnamed protein product [Dovyalis caffra]|uniref:Glutamate receptor n=1 Tax=Dovyalis caffra TaxID=77055 RepID=A0AAV1SMD7_9ROSI|nr:unnamed protein product [Dovyalis caffra]
MGLAQNTTTPIGVNVGVVLDLEILDFTIALSCIKMALLDFYATHGRDYNTSLVLTTRNSKTDVVGAAAAEALVGLVLRPLSLRSPPFGYLGLTLDLIKNVEVQAIIGPSTSMQANFVIEVGEKAQVPIISFSASSPSISSFSSPYFFRATHSDSSQVNAISAIVQVFGWRQAVPIYVDNEYGKGIIPYLTDALQAVDARVPYQSVISPSATDDQLGEELYKLMTMQARVFIVQISPNPSVTDTMQGVLGVKPYVPSTEGLKDFRVRWKRKFQLDNPEIIDAELSVYGLWAYDAATALAMAVEKAGTANLGFQKGNDSSNSTDLATLGVSLIGPNLLQALSNTSFKGLTGDYFFVNGQLQSSSFQIVNVNGNVGREIGFWTPKEGLLKKLNSTSSSGISTVIWPGDGVAVPKGWEAPTNEKKLRIGVPVNLDDNNKYLSVRKDPSSNTTKITGFCIDVFEAVVKQLPYALPYEYFPFAKPDGKPAGTYNDLVDQVYLKSYTASFTSLLTVQQLQPKVADMKELIKGRDYVGYEKNSFILDMLLELGFNEDRLVAYTSSEEYEGLFSKRSGHGGIAAAFGESPYVKVFLSKYCRKYTTADRIFRTGGFGFVFPKGSPLVPDISREILNITEGDTMKKIEDAWLGDQSTCPDSDTLISSTRLGLESFWGLFLISGLVSLSALIIFTAAFVYKERAVISDSTTSIWIRVKNLIRIFNQRVSIRSDLNQPGVGVPTPAAESVHTEIHGDLSSQEDNLSPNREAPQEVEINIDQPTNPNQERPTANGIDHDSN